METIKESNLPNTPENRGETEKYNNKISREDFTAMLNENDGNFEDTAKAIAAKYNTHYTRQAAEAMAKRIKTEETEENEELIRMAKEVVKQALKQNADEKMRLRTAFSILKNPKKFT